MKNIKSIVYLIILCGMVTKSYSQSINWASLKNEQKHIISICTGWDYGLIYGVGYNFKLNSKMPILLNASFVAPVGKNKLDDIKTKIGGQFRILNMNNFHVTTSIHGIYRQYENPLVKLRNFGSEITATFGYYKSGWFLAGEAGFDKAIVTYFKHSNSFKEILYSNVTDGWYEPATGGNFSYGIVSSFSIKNSDLTLRIGKLVTQDFKTTPLIPLYAQFSCNFKLKGKFK